MINIDNFNKLLFNNIKIIMVFWIKDIGGYYFDPSLKCPTEPSIICGSITYTNKMCGTSRYALRIYLKPGDIIDLKDDDLTVLYIKALLTKVKYNR